MNDINEKKSILPYYLIKRVMNFAAILFYVVGGIVMLALIPSLSMLHSPWIEMTRISVLALILSGIGFFILATAPAIAKEEKKEEIVLEMPNDVTEPGTTETRKEMKTETIIQEISNPLPSWRGHHLSSLLNILQPESQGTMPFPSAEGVERENLRDMEEFINKSPS